MKNALLLLTISAAALGCGPASTMLIHPSTGERVTCRATVIPNTPFAPFQGTREECIGQHETIGFVQVDRSHGRTAQYDHAEATRRCRGNKKRYARKQLGGVIKEGRCISC